VVVGYYSFGFSCVFFREAPRFALFLAESLGGVPSVGV